MKRCLAGMVILAAWLGADGPAAERVALRVDMAGIKTSAACPVRSGVPLGRGKLKDPANARLLIGNTEGELQTRVLATWPDKSVKWLLLDFMAKDGDQAALEYGPGVKRKAVAGGLKATKTADAITIDNGLLRFTVRKNGTGFLDALSFDKNGNKTYDADEAIIQPAAAGEQRYFLDFVHRPRASVYGPLGSYMPAGEAGRSRVQITELTLEEEGPLHCVILVRGKHKVAKLAARIADQVRGEGQSDFTMRIHAYKDRPEIRAEAHFVFDGVGDDDFIKAWGVRFKAGAGLAFTTLGADGQTLRVAPDPQAPFVALTQTSADAYKVWQADASRLGETVAGQGRRSCGWVDIGNDQWGVTVGTRWFWQRWPNAIHYDSQTGEVDLMLYPPEVQVMDLRRYARHEWGVGETSAPEGDLEAIAPFASKGTANSKQICLVFRRGKADLPALQQQFQVFHTRPLAVAAPAYYSQTHVFGYYAPRVAGQRDAFEAKAAARLQRYIKAQEEARWYGMWDFGDCQQRFGEPDSAETHKHMRWENDWGRWAWGHGDGHGRVGRAYLMQYLRTGERAYFDMGEAHVRHRNDADIRESREIPWDYSVRRKIPPERTKGPWWDLRGCASRHGVQHWSGSYIGARGGNPLGQRVYYYLTGNGRCADMLDIAAEMAMTKYGWGGYEKVAQRLGHSGGGDGMGTALQSILIAWERTGDAKYREGLKTAVREGSPCYGMLHPKGHWNIGMTTSFGAMQAVAEYGDLSGDEAAKTIVLDAAAIVKDLNRRNWMWPDSFQAIVAEACRLTKNPDYAKLADDMVEAQLKKGLGFNALVALTYQYEAMDQSKNK